MGGCLRLCIKQPTKLVNLLCTMIPVYICFPNLKTNNKCITESSYKSARQFLCFLLYIFFRVVSRYKSCDKNMFVFRCLGRVRSRTPACFCGDSIIISTHLHNAHTHTHAHLTEQEDSRPITYSDSCVVWAGTQSPSYDTIGVSQSRYGFFHGKHPMIDLTCIGNTNVHRQYG